MSTGNGSGSLGPLEARLAELGDATRRRSLETVLARLRSELTMDVDGILGTLAPGFELETRSAGAQRRVVGREALARMFRAMATDPSSSAWIDVERLVVDDDAVVLTGDVRMLLPATVADALGYTSAGGGASRSVTYAAVIVFELEHGLLTREVLYVDPATTLVTDV